MARILAVGISTLDVINEVASYPLEDQETRVLAQSIRRGGNATNTLAVLSQLGHQCEWAGVLVDEPNAEVIKMDLAGFNIGTRYCRFLRTGRMPVSYITLSRDTVSRTIVHHRDLPEYDFARFREVQPRDFDWIHFEGRNVDETASMMKYLREQAQCPPVSLEVEKPRDGIEKLYREADLIMFSHTMTAHSAYEPERYLRQVAAMAPRADLLCTLGAKGALALSREGQLYQSLAFPPSVLLDTIGAGDTFNAAIIDRLLGKDPLPRALEFACRLAGKKCGQHGFGNLVPVD